MTGKPAPVQVRRQRAANDRIRAYVRVPGKHYDVWSKGHCYKVWYNYRTFKWECICNSRVTCKHITRVEDREAKRVHLEELMEIHQHGN